MTSREQDRGWVSRMCQRMVRDALTVVIALVSAALATRPAQAQTYSVLYSFGGSPTDGAFPLATLVRDAAGNLYGTTSAGGSGCIAGCGTVFKVDTTGTETVLYRFTGLSDGAFPDAGLVRDSAGNLYGTTYGGGSGGCPRGCGVVFKLNTTGTETVLHTFTGGADGWDPLGGLVRDSAGNLYGTTSNSDGFNGFGVVYKVDTTGTEIVLYSFTGGADGGNPGGTLLLSPAGTLWGTTVRGGTKPGHGVVFRLGTNGRETVLHRFRGYPADGAFPVTGLVRDSAGNLYGTTSAGGAFGQGVAFKLDTTGILTVLHSFSGKDGAKPLAGLLRDSVGNLYGTTYGGGASGKGVVFKLTP